MKKKKVTRRECLEYGDFIGKFDDVIEFLQHKKKDYPEDAHLDIYIGEEYDYPSLRVDVLWEEEETDWECKNREAMEANQKECRRKQFEVLKKEFN